jgi:hypothetical protein
MAGLVGYDGEFAKGWIYKEVLLIINMLLVVPVRWLKMYTFIRDEN